MLVKISTSPYYVHTCMNIVMLYAKELKKTLFVGWIQFQSEI